MIQVTVEEINMRSKPGDRMIYHRREKTLARPRRRARLPNRLFALSSGSDENMQVQAAKYGVVVLALSVTTWALWPVKENIGLLNIGLVFLIVVLMATL